MKLLFFVLLSILFAYGHCKLNCAMVTKAQLCSRFYVGKIDCVATIEVAYRDKMACNAKKQRNA